MLVNYLTQNVQWKVKNAFSLYFNKEMSAEGKGPAFSPTCVNQPLLASPASVQPENEKKNEGVQMRKELGLLEGTAIILGIIMGSGNTTDLFLSSTS